MDSKEDDFSKEKDRPPEESSSWFSPSSWFSSRDKKSTEYKWEPGKYQSDFFNKFDPKKVFDKRTKESKELRKKFIKEMFDEVFKIDIKATYFKDLSRERSARDDINLMYKARPIATYSTKHDTISQKRGKMLSDFKEAVRIQHMFDSTQRIEPQVENYMEPEPEGMPEEEFQELIDELESLRKTPFPEPYKGPRILDDDSDSDRRSPSPEPESDISPYHKKKLEELNKRITRKNGKVYVDGYLVPDGMSVDYRFYDGKNRIRDEVEENKNDPTTSAAKEFFGGLASITSTLVKTTGKVAYYGGKGAIGVAKYVDNKNGNPTETVVENVKQ